MRLEFGPLTEPLPQPPDPLQQVYGAIQDAYRANDPFEQLTCAINTNICFRTPLPDALFVPDVTGSRDAVTFVIGRSATSLFADRFPSFDFGSGGGSTEFIGTGGETLVSGTGAVAEVPSEGVLGEITAGPELGGLGTGSTLGGPVAAGTAGFGEDRFLGAAAPERFRALYLLGILVMAAVGVGGSFAIRALGR